MKLTMQSIILFFLTIIILPLQAQELPVTTTSKEARAHFELGRLDAFHYQGPQALEHLDAALAIDSTFVLAYLHRGGMSPTVEEAKPYFKQAVKYRSHVTKGEQRLIDAFLAFLQEGNPQGAIEIFRELSIAYPDDPYLPSYLGLRYLRNMDMYPEASIQFKRAIKRDSLFIQAYNWLGYAEAAQGNYKKAEVAFKKYLNGAPDQPRPYNSLGDLYFEMGNYEQATNNFEKAIVKDPGFKISRDKLMLTRIHQVYKQFKMAVKQQDAEKIASLYSESGQILRSESNLFEGREEIERYWEDKYKMGLSNITMETLELFTSSDGLIQPHFLFHWDAANATEIGQYQLMTDKGISEKGKYIMLWMETPEGWKVFRDFRTTDTKPDE